MNGKRYCLECQNLIEEGKEVKIEKGKRNYWDYHYRSNWSRGNYTTTYYLCLSCFKKQQTEMRARRDKEWIYSLGIGGG